MGLIKVKDAEKGTFVWIDSASHSVREKYRQWWEERQTLLTDLFAKNGIDNVLIRTDEDYVKPLIKLFKHR